VNKAFVKEADGLEDAPDDDVEADSSALPKGSKNYITPAGHARLKAELTQLLDVERPEVVRTVAWAASNGDRSENADYIYGKRRLREIDRRIRFLIKRLDIAEVVDSGKQENPEQVFFGATVTVADRDGAEHRYRIVGMDEVDPSRGDVSWISPVAKALLKARLGDTVVIQTPGGVRELDIVDVKYGA
jgi:transcription elongation factor GreB